MKNGKKYKDEILESIRAGELLIFINKHVLPRFGVVPKTDKHYMALFFLWLNEEYEEPEVDWTKVEVDTPIWVSDIPECGWWKAHFAKYEDGTIYAWWGGSTSWTVEGMTEWKYAKLAEEESDD